MNVDMEYWEDDGFGMGACKPRYLRDYTLKNGRTKGLREVEIQHLADLTMRTDRESMAEYFETLPSNFKKAFKTAWRQREHKMRKGKNEQIEVERGGKDFLAKMVERYVAHHPERAGDTLAAQRTNALDWFLNTQTPDGISFNDEWLRVTK